MILGLDLGASCGWALLDSETAIYSDGGTQEIKLKSKDNKAKKWIEFRSWLCLTLDLYKPDLVAVEDVARHVGVHAAHAYGFYRYCMESECLVRNIPVLSLSVGQWKKISAGKGNSQKEEVAAAMNKIYPHIIFKSDDHSDAVGIARAAWAISLTKDVRGAENNDKKKDRPNRSGRSRKDNGIQPIE